jgi:hypothetical protein
MDDDKKRIKVINLIIALVMIILSVIIVVVILSNKTDYEKLEKEMVRIAKEKVETQNIEVKIQDFMNLEALNITDGAEVCSKASGVIITNVNGRLEYKAYLKCVDYESTILKNSKKYIKLKGSAVVLANKNAMYFDEGYEQIDNNITIEKVGTVINEPGAYTINYVVKKNGKQKTIVKRIVIVSDVDIDITQSGIVNKTEPTITLKGEKEMYLTINSQYNEPGYSAYDYKDGKINREVKVSGNVDTTKVGSNKITYTVKNSQGKMYSIDRIVHVVKEVADLNISISADDKGSTTNKSIITLAVSGNGFSKIILPNGNENPFPTASYGVTKNGVYTFVVVDIYNNKINKSIVVDNIDNIAPTGTCDVKNNNGVYEFNVIGEDESGISAVNYIIDGKESGFLATTFYQTKEKVSKASVILQDVAGNQTKVSCSVDNIVAREESTYSFKYTRKEDIDSKPYISCNSYTASDRIALETNLKSEVEMAGYGTRAGVVAAARFLVGGLEYKIKYLGPKNSAIDPNGILGRYNKEGLNIANNKGWGCSVNGWTQGMDCTNFVQWAFTNGGVKLNSIYSTANTASAKESVDKIKVGDLMLTPCNGCTTGSAYQHVGIVIGIDSSKIYVAEATTGNINAIIVSELDKNNMPSTGKFSIVKFYQYSSDGNITNMWK